MDPKVRGTQLQTLLSYDDIEHLCTWQREDGQDVLVIQLPEFKKEQLRIHISNTGLLKISGEKVVEGKKRRFLKEVKVTKDYDSNNIHAKFSQGCLRVTLPKKIVALPSMSKTQPAVAMPSPQDSQSDNVNTNGKTTNPGIKTRAGQTLKSKTFTRVMVTIGFASVAAFSVYTAYKYWTSYVQVDED
ncbi:hypothetical protein L1987_00293 [Smallanthus sonchifolius]|uniref:Uncharacterized protein n=1 Tax=Smallanthus sonchifolius TaxID=185202 RepID=A0ACB9K1X8_9ASTR|nr:hypothetical protein L1987_00293 [Smallanthus sonchifolius]